jgi:hypothetical protein
MLFAFLRPGGTCCIVTLSRAARSWQRYPGSYCPRKWAYQTLLSVTVSSWPIVSLAKPTGTKAPINATISRVSKNTPGDPVYNSNRNGTQRHEHTGGDSAGRLAEILTAPAQGCWKLGEVNAHGREGRQHSEAGNQRPGDTPTVAASPARCAIASRPGKRAGEAVGDRPPPSDDLHDESGKALAGNACEEHQRTRPKAQGHCGARSTRAFGSRMEICVVGNPRSDARHKIPTTVQRSWPRRSSRYRRKPLAYQCKFLPERGDRQWLDATAASADDPVDGRKRTMISCSPLCTSGISKVKRLVVATPISMMVLRLQWSDIADFRAHPPSVGEGDGGCCRALGERAIE